MLKLPLKVPSKFRIIAHRGASGYAPENTLAAFRLAQEMSVCEVELDVQFSKDRELVLCHDRVLDRYGYPGLRVADLTLEELTALDMGSWFSPYLYGGERLITLERLFRHFGDRFTYHVELKAPTEGLTQAVRSALESFELLDRAMITSFHFDALVEMQERAPELSIGWLIKEHGLSKENVDRAARAGFHQICPRAEEVNQANVRAAHSAISEVRAHNVMGVPEMVQAIEAGCDGLTINWPDWLVHEGDAIQGDPSR